MKIIAAGTDISGLAGKVAWSGDSKQFARKLSFSYAHTNRDDNITKVDVPLGSRVLMYDDAGRLKFDGVTLTQNKNEAGVDMTVGCKDMAFYLRSKVYNTYKGTPAQIVMMVCYEFGIPTGLLYDLPVVVSVVSTGEKMIYQIIEAAYEAAGVDIYIYMEGLIVCTEIPGTRLAAVYTGDDSVTDAVYQSSIEDLVDQVYILDKKGKFLRSVQNDADMAAYGVVREIYKAEDGTKDADAEAGKLIRSVENSGSIEVTVSDYEAVTGRRIMVMKAGSRIAGEFIIVSDSHSIENGKHTAKLGLDFKGAEI
ncbi:MAG: hypothetical protein HFI11_07755 [Lachnospiraceae bacterium]|nr:hypothetical protein [Lachnospiraceae bacterium]